MRKAKPQRVGHPGRVSVDHPRARKRTPKGQLRLRFPEQEEWLQRFWQRRYYDFNVYSRAKVLEKLHYMHSNPVRDKLVAHPGDWPWSNWCFYYRGAGLIAVGPWDSPSASFYGKPQQREERPTLCEKQNRKG